MMKQQDTIRHFAVSLHEIIREGTYVKAGTVLTDAGGTRYVSFLVKI